jgi:hypothetical protein
VGSRSFVENVKALLGFRAKGRDVIGGNEGYQLREGSAPYKEGFWGPSPRNRGNRANLPVIGISNKEVLEGLAKHG